MTMDYYSDEVFTAPHGEILAKAAEDGMTWALLGYLQQWCLSNAFAEKGVNLLIETYRTLGCHPNCWFLSERYLAARRIGASKSSASVAPLGLEIGASIQQNSGRFELPPAENMWAERDLVLKEIKNDPRSLSPWLELVGKYVELEELLMAVMTLFVVRINAPFSAAIWPTLKEQLDLMKVYGTSGGFWAFVAEDVFFSKVSEILSGDKTREEVADSVGILFASSFALPVHRDNLLRPFVWPKCNAV